MLALLEMTPSAGSTNEGVAIYDRRRRRALGPPPAADGIADEGDDSSRLLVLFGVFAIAALVVVVALLGAAAIDTWGALAAVLVVHAAMTATSFAGVIFLLSGQLRASGHLAHSR